MGGLAEATGEKAEPRSPPTDVRWAVGCACEALRHLFLD